MKKNKNIKFMGEKMKKIISIMLLGFIISPMHISADEIVNIPGKHLKACINDKLGQGSSEEITKTQMESINDLNCYDDNIINLTGIERATNLDFLYLANNKISDITALKDLKKLTDLSLGKTEIEDITPLKDLTHLESLDLANNGISDITVLKDLTHLQSLDLANNKIEDITALKDLTHLQSLDLANNKIEDITVLKDKTSLTDLNLRINKISDITALKDLTKLYYLYLDKNQISDITALKDLTDLTVLHLESNKIEDVTALKDLTNLTTLALLQNQITDFSSLKNIPVTIISNNQKVERIIPSVKTGKKEYEYKTEVIEQDGTVHELSFIIDTDKLKEGENEIVKGYDFSNGYTGVYKIKFVYYPPTPIGTPDVELPEAHKPDGNKPDGNIPDGNIPDAEDNNGMKIVSTGSSNDLLIILAVACAPIAIYLKRRIRL